VLLTGGGENGAASSTSTTTTTAATTTSAATTTTAQTTTTAATTTTAQTTTTAATTTTRATRTYSEAELAYFQDIAGQAEYGDAGGLVHKWTKDLRIAVFGEPTERDRTALANVVDDLNGIIDGVELSLVETNPNVQIYFVPETEFASILPEYVPVNMGFVYIWWDGAGAVTDAVILISTTGITPEERAHLIREELTQSLGLLNDSPQYEDSIFQVEWTSTNRFAPIDRALIEMLYRPELVPGMTIADALEALAAIPAG
jgi:hypothetical protein